MTGLPQGVTLERWGLHAVQSGEDLWTVYRRAGWVLLGVLERDPFQGGPEWGALPHSQVIPNSGSLGRLFSDPLTAARWLCLQARPVVYQVRPCTDPGHTDWEVRGPEGRVDAASTQEQAMNRATWIGRRRIAQGASA